MPRSTFRLLVCGLVLAVAAGLALALAQTIVVKDSQALTRAVSAAKAGQTLMLSAGAFPAMTLPAGVKLRGAGVEKTIIDAASAPAAISAGGKGSAIEDLSIRTHGTSAIDILGGTGIAVRRVKIRGGAIGIRAGNVTGLTIENVVIDGSLTGMTLAKLSRASIANCTLTRCNSLGMSLLDVTDSAIFNNITADAGIGIMVGGKRSNLHIDYNLYLALFVGRLEGQMTRIGLAPWRDVTGGYDAHSVQLPVKFADPDNGDYRVTSTLEWAPWQATTSEWGTPALATFTAPKQDINGHARVGAVDLGACETSPLPAKPDGTFKISADDGTKSAGLFTKNGIAVRYLFHNLPLKKGTYGFVLPSRNQQGQPLPAGDYEIRVAEGNLRWKYRMMVGNNGLDCSMLNADQNSIWRVAWGADGALLLGLGWNERGQNILAVDVATHKGQWSFAGSADNNGLAVGGDGTAYLLRAMTGGFQLMRIDATTHTPTAWAPDEVGRNLLTKENHFNGLAELAGKLYLADTAGKLFITSATDPKLDKFVPLEAPSLPIADRKHQLIWLISGEKVIAVDTAGQTKVTVTAVANPCAIATNGDRLAIASRETGKIHFFNLTDAANPQADGTLGRGDGPYGPIVPDRFWFQTGPYNEKHTATMAMDARGRLAINDASNRAVVFDVAGKALYQNFAHFGNAPYRAYFDDNGDKVRFFDNSGTWSWFIDPKNNTWTLDAFWGKPPLNQGGGNPPINYFSCGGKKFGAFLYATPDEPKTRREGALIVRYDNYVGKPVALYTNNAVIRDTNGDGVISVADGAGTPLTDTNGQPVRMTLNGRWIAGLPDGSIHNGIGQVWKLNGLDTDGNPLFVFPTAPGTAIKVSRIPSPYNFAKQVDLNGQSESAFAANGDALATVQSVEAAPNGMGLSNSGGIDLFRAAPDGTIKWYLPLNDYGPLQGVKAIDKFILTSYGHQTQWIGLDEDGLEIGQLGYPEEIGWLGYWVDHPQQYRLFTGSDGQAHVTVGDYMENCQYWLTLENYNTYKKTSFPLTIAADKAAALAAQPAQPVSVLAKPAQPRITVARLKEPLPIDGELTKWRKAGITPQIIMTPVTAGIGIDGPADASGVIRMAYEGNDLYVQVLRFDDVVTFHQTIERGTHIQDTIEMMINGFFPRGFQFSVGHFSTDGDQIVRRRFFFGNGPYLVPTDHAPRVIKVLDNAKDVEERKLIEATYGIDMSNCKVIVTEFKLPIDKITWKDSVDTLFEVGSGKTFWLGFMIDDNDVPGTDVQNLIVWPASYGTFDPAEKGALATFE